MNTNLKYLDHLLHSTDICCIQEHWLYEFQLTRLNSIHDNFRSHAKAVDSRNPIPPIQIPRGYGGNAILYRSNWDLKVSLPPDGCERIVVLELETSPPVCIVSVYLPCRGNSTTKQFEDVLQQLEELLKKYSSGCAVFVCGDFNASLTRNPPNERDILLRNFTAAHGLNTQQSGDPTFFHVSGNSSSEIDYILKNHLAHQISSPTQVHDQHPDNVSDHIPVFTVINIPAKQKNPETMITPKPDWDKCDKDLYRSTLMSSLGEWNDRINQNTEDMLLELKTVMDHAASCSIPRYQPNTLKKKKRSRLKFSQEIREASKKSKEAWGKWKAEGKPADPSNSYRAQMILAKKLLRKSQRIARAVERKKQIEDIMQSRNTSETFHRLIKKQRSRASNQTNCLIIEGTPLTNVEEIKDGWASHFKLLATSQDNRNYDQKHLEQAQTDIQWLEALATENEEAITPTDPEEVRKAVFKLNNRKAPDHMGLTSEHLKHGGLPLFRQLSHFFNVILAQKQIPTSLRHGTITPVHKKGDIKLPDNYRGITVTPILLKTIEHVINERHKKILHPTQSILQTGFTKGTSSTKSALLVSECLQEAKDENKHILFTTLDTRKAFDVVNHNLLLRNLFLDGIPLQDWSFIKNLYTDMKSNVKWQGLLSESFCIGQGVRQGGVLSTEHYKRFNNPLLLKLESNFQGAKIGNINIPHTTCADDIALLSHHEWEMKLMLGVVDNYSKQHRYDINATKSACIAQQYKKMDREDISLTLGEEHIPLTDQTTHLGISRNTKSKLCVEEKINLGKRTAYSLLGAGFHGNTGLDQKSKAVIWTIHIVPRMIYGIETTPYCDTDLKKLDSYQVKALKQIQHLPDRAPNAAITAIMGIPPLTAQIHKATINLLYSTLKSTDSIEHEVATRQLAVKRIEDGSFFSRARRLLILYDLPSAYSLLSETPDEEPWKKMLNEAVNSKVEKDWQTEISQKSSLKYLNPAAVRVGCAHPIYQTVKPNLHDVKRAEIKARLLLGVYTLQSNRAVFNQHLVDPTCRLCKSGAETREHFIAQCSNTNDIREKSQNKLRSILSRHPNKAVEDNLNDPGLFTQLMLDSSLSCLERLSPLQDMEREQIEVVSRELIQALHIRRCSELAGQDP